ncbi:MAG: hypothetical protein CSA33_01250 [Desulfobulbus propionicus]|nr:MAG: hypothetical protein CSA33_01250 [Desulfobulbus propionicus]
MQPQVLKTSDLLALPEHRCHLLRRINAFKLTYDYTEDNQYILQEYCKILIQDPEFSLLWIGKRSPENAHVLVPLFAISDCYDQVTCRQHIAQILAETEYRSPARQTMTNRSPEILQPETLQQLKSPTLQQVLQSTRTRSIASWPLVCHQRDYGVLTIYATNPEAFREASLSFLTNIQADISLTLYLDETAKCLHQQRDYNTDLVNTLQVLLVFLTPSGQILSLNRKAQETTGYTQEEARGKDWIDLLIAQDKKQNSQARFSGLLKTSRSEIHFTTEILAKNGAKKVIHWNSSMQSHSKNGQIGLVLLGQDITSTVTAVHEKENALAHWNNLFTAIQEPALVVSENGIILDVNPSTCTAAKKPKTEIVSQPVCEILYGERSPAAACPLEAMIKKKTNKTFETELKGLHGKYMMTVSPLAAWAGAPGASLLLARDLTDKQLMQAEAMRAAHLASVGELAAGVAHEINNPINGIINYAQILSDNPSDAKSGQFLQAIIQESQRIAGITRRLLDFARKTDETPGPTNIQQIVTACIELIQHQYSKDGIEMVQHFKVGLPAARCNSHQLQQVLLNIFSNARHALNEKFHSKPDEKKLITLNADCKYLQGQQYIQLAVTDNGTGIRPEIINRIMDPFFSTKPQGQGTGLGLSISQSLIQENGGVLRVQSEQGAYTTVLVDLPASKSP